MKKNILYAVCLCLIFMPTIPAIFASQDQSGSATDTSYAVPDMPDKEALMARGYGYGGGYRGGHVYRPAPHVYHHRPGHAYRHGFFACAPVIP